MSMGDGARVCVLCETRYRGQGQPRGLIRALRAGGHDVNAFDPALLGEQVGLASWPATADLVVARGRSPAVLAALMLAERLRVPTINHRIAVDAVHNKLDMAVTLATAAVPVPPTWIGPAARLARRIPPSAYPLLLKPIFGDNATGLRLAQDPAGLRDMRWPEPIVLAQRYLPSDGHDVKVYGIGERLFAVRKPSPFCPDGRVVPTGVERVPLTSELAALGERCRDLFGLDLFGVDCLEGEAGVVVIEVNEFPNYTGVPDADELLAEHVLTRLPARRAPCGSPS
jgi:ribosomal protein S6--L-glutamate ligase